MAFPTPIPPVLVDPTNFSRQSRSEVNPMMALFGSNIYLTLVNDQVPTPPRISIYLSADNGDTWTEEDVAGTPDIADSFPRFTTFFDTNANLIHVLFDGPSFGPQIGHFATAPTNAWQTVGTEGSFAISPSGNNFFYQKTNGDFVFLSGGFGSGSTHIYAITNIADVWDAGTDTGLSGTVVGGVRDSSDAVHLTYRSSGVLSYARVASDFTTSTPHVLLASGAVLFRPTVVLYSTDSEADKESI